MHTSMPTQKILSSLTSAFSYTCYAAAAFTLAILLVGFVPQMEGTEVRRFVNKDVAQLRPEDYPKPIEMQGSWSVRSQATKTVREHDHAQVQTQKGTANTVTNWVEFSEHDTFLNTVMGNRSFERTATSLALVLAQDASIFGQGADADTAHALNLVSTQLSQQGEALTPSGTPLRWAQAAKKTSVSGAVQKASFALLCDLGRPSIDAIQSKLLARDGRANNYGFGYVAAVPGSIPARAKLYKDIISQVSKKFNIR